MRLIAGLALTATLFLAGCVSPTTGTAPRPATSTAAPTQAERDQLREQVRVAANRFISVSDRIEPVAEAECRRQTPDLNCDFLITVDNSADAPVNAFQMRDDTGRPLIVVTVPMIAYVANDDELAFVLAHEAAHHIARHLDRRRKTAEVGALIFASAAARGGFGGRSVSEAAQLGAQVGSRVYAKDFELEADAIGARIARSAGFDAINGAQYFARAPDPGDRFLGSHPPNSDRVAAVRRALAGS